MQTLLFDLSPGGFNVTWIHHDEQKPLAGPGICNRILWAKAVNREV